MYTEAQRPSVDIEMEMKRITFDGCFKWRFVCGWAKIGSWESCPMFMYSVDQNYDSNNENLFLFTLL